MPVDPAKLAKLQKLSGTNKIGGIRRKQVSKENNSKKDDTKLLNTMASLKAVNMSDVAEANFFQENGQVLHFDKVGVQVAAQNNTTAFYGMPKEKQLQELFPNIITQLGDDSLNALTQMAQQMELAKKAQAGAEANSAETADDGIPSVEGKTFEDDVE
ncbi:hypothetical protein ACO0QE_002566 [Hanseniaspora vineae]